MSNKTNEAMIDGLLEIFYDTKSRAAKEFLLKDFEKAIGKNIEKFSRRIFKLGG